MDKKTREKIERIAGYMLGAKSMLFITGAGISAESGLPTYRGIGGLYNNRQTDDGIPIETALSGAVLRQNPQLTWKYLSEIEKNCRKARPNRAHEIIALLERRFERVWVLTQNIDGFHRQAGSRNVIDIHGDMHELVCMDCRSQIRVSDYGALSIPPRCNSCRGILRPKVVFFGEMVPTDKFSVLAGQLQKGFDICFSIGTTSVFPYIQQPVLAANRAGKPVVEINPGASEVSHLSDIKLSLGAQAALEEIWQTLLSKT